jgi:hypothetical protein
MADHTTPASLRVPIDVTDMYPHHGITTFAGFQRKKGRSDKGRVSGGLAQSRCQASSFSLKRKAPKTRKNIVRPSNSAADPAMPDASSHLLMLPKSTHSDPMLLR